jgi:hypothetical protein
MVSASLLYEIKRFLFFFDYRICFGAKNLFIYFSFVHAALGVNSVDPPPFSIVEVATKECTPITPILMIVTPGIDPTVELEEVFIFVCMVYSSYDDISLLDAQWDIPTIIQ